MKICVPAMGNNGVDDSVGDHFGRAPYYTVVDTENNRVRIVPNTSEHMGGDGYPPEIIHSTGADVLVCSGLGRRAVMMFEQLGIRVYVGASGSIQNAIDMWKKGKLQVATDDNACEQHAFKRKNHDHHCGD